MKLTLFLTLLTFSSALSFNFRRNDRGYNEFVEDEHGEHEHEHEHEHDHDHEGLLAIIDFTEDWEENVHGELGVGRNFHIDYAGSRLSKTPVSVEYKFNDGPDFQTESMGSPDSNDVYHKTLSIPIDADKIVIWFKGGDPPEYDSDYGKNYNFPITKPSIVFLEGWQEKQHGNLVRGQSFDLFYNSRRLNTTSEVEAQMKFVGDDVVGITLHAREDSLYQQSIISIPENAEKLEMWFYYEDDEGTKHYDSDYGQNYHFNLS